MQFATRVCVCVGQSFSLSLRICPKCSFLQRKSNAREFVSVLRPQPPFSICICGLAITKDGRKESKDGERFPVAHATQPSLSAARLVFCCENSIFLLWAAARPGVGPRTEQWRNRHLSYIHTYIQSNKETIIYYKYFA